jgi:hypothetical protein
VAAYCGGFSGGEGRSTLISARNGRAAGAGIEQAVMKIVAGRGMS